MALCQLDGLIEYGAPDCDDLILATEMLQEECQRVVTRPPRDPARSPVPRGQRRCHLDHRYLADYDGVAGARIAHLPDPGRADLRQVALDDRTAVEEVVR